MNSPFKGFMSRIFVICRVRLTAFRIKINYFPLIEEIEDVTHGRLGVQE